MRLLKISIFALKNVIVRLTKVMNNHGKDFKNLIFKVIFQHQKMVESFQKKYFEEYLIGKPTLVS